MIMALNQLAKRMEISRNATYLCGIYLNFLFYIHLTTEKYFSQQRVTEQATQNTLQHLS